jgi:hypothetical protein
LLHDLPDVTAKREAVLEGAAAIRVSARVAGEENEYVGTP